MHQRQRWGRIEPCSQAGPLTPPPTPTTTVSLMGQTNGRHRAYVCTLTHARAPRTQITCLILASAPGSCYLSLLTPSSSSFLFSPTWSSRSESYRCQILWGRREDKDEEKCYEETRKRGREGVCVSSGLHAPVGSSEYAFRHFWGSSLAHSAFLSSVPPFP